MINIINKMFYIKRTSLFSIISLLLFNILFYFFLPFNSYNSINISTEIEANNTTTIWYVYKEKNSSRRFFSDTVNVKKNQTLKYKINTNKEIDYIGLFWVAKKESEIKIKAYKYFIDSTRIISNDKNNLIHYISKGSATITNKEGVIIQSTSSKRNWIMLNEIQKINKLRLIKTHRFIPFYINILLFLFFFIGYQYTKQQDFLDRKEKISLNDIRALLFYFWCFIFPFWIILSHILMVIISLITIYESVKKEKTQNLLKNINYSFILFYLWILVSSCFSSTTKQVLDTALDFSYFLLMPLVFSSLNLKIKKRGLKYFELGMFVYLFLILIYSIVRKLELNVGTQFIIFFKNNLEIFWHTSYISAFMLILFIIKHKEPLFRNYKLILFYIGSLIFIYLMDARIPFIVGSLLITYKIYKSYAKSKIVKTGFIIAVFLSFISLIGFFLIRESSEKVNTYQNIENINSIDARTSLWKASYKVIKQHYIFGVGNKNTINSISKVLDNKTNIKFRKFNAHNQFIESFLSNGFLGLVFLLLIFFHMLQKSNIYAKIFIFSCILLFMVESYLQREAGLIFFTFWYSFFISINKKIK